MLNQPVAVDFELEDIIENRLYELKTQLKKEGFEVEISDFKYEFFNRCESLGIDSEKLYPNEDLPDNFGVYRGYAGGGMHSGLSKSEFDRLPARRQAKAQRVLGYFEEAFRGVLSDTDKLSEINSGEDLQEWDTVSI